MDSFPRNGFSVLEGFVAMEELAALRSEVDTALAGPLPPGCERPHNTLAPLRWNDPPVQRVLGSRRRLAALSSALAARDLRWVSAYVSVKAPGSEALWWHQDWWCWDHPVTYRPDAAQVAVLCYLNDTTARSGALRVLPGTHRRSVPLHGALPEAHAREAGELDPGEAAMRDQPGQIALELKAGDAVVTDYRLLHGTYPNHGEQRRDCLLLSFTPSWAGLPKEVRAHLIRHPALPSAEERPAATASLDRLLPGYEGEPRDLALNRAAPREFEMSG